MQSYAELEINLVSLDGLQCQVQMRFRPSNSQSEVRLSSAGNIDLSKLGDRNLDSNAYSQALTKTLFASPQISKAFSESLMAAFTSGAFLRLRLWIDSASSALHDVGWELLLNPIDGTRLANGERVMLSRGLSTLAAQPLSMKPPEDAVALLAAANPSDLPNYTLEPIDTDAELCRVQKHLAGLGAIRTLPDKNGARTTFDHLFAALTPDVDLLYLACHGTLAGNDGWLWLEAPDGKVRRISATQFVERVRGLPVFPELVVLASCQSAGGKSGPAWRSIGPRLVEAGIPAVLAMQGNFTMESEALFMPRFFESLREHGETDRALSYARAFIADRPDWWMPVLFSHVRDNRIFSHSNPNAAPTIALQPFEPETVYIPAGDFWMGSDDPDAQPFEKPAYRIKLPSFRIGKYPVTNRQFAEFVRQAKRVAQPGMGWAGQNPPANQFDHPVQGVTWYEAVEYCKWLSTRTGRSYRLPSEAEWEKSARGIDGRRYPWGDNWDPARCAPTNQVASVTSLPAQSPYGIYDLVGNIREWTCSLWGQNRQGPDPAYLYPWAGEQQHELEASKLVRRVIRGAGRTEDPASFTCYSRNSYIPDNPGPPGKRHGFRVVLEI